MDEFLDFSMECYSCTTAGMTEDEAIVRAKASTKAKFKATQLGRRVPESRAERLATEFAERISETYYANISEVRCKKIALDDDRPGVKAAATTAAAAYRELAVAYLRNETVTRKREEVFLAVAALTREQSP